MDLVSFRSPLTLTNLHHKIVNIFKLYIIAPNFIPHSLAQLPIDYGLLEGSGPRSTSLFQSLPSNYSIMRGWASHPIQRAYMDYI